MHRTSILAVALAAAILSSAQARADAPNPVVTGPITGGTQGAPFGAMSAADLKSADYIENEYFFEGSATSYSKVGAWTADGVWPVAPATTAPYKVRMSSADPPKRTTSMASWSSSG